MKHYFLGLASNYTWKHRLQHTFVVGRKKDCLELESYLAKRYSGDAILCKNGRSALALALKAYFEPGDAILVNGFTCYAVYEAVKAAKLVPIFVDISKDDLNFSDKALVAACPSDTLRAAQAKSSRSAEHIATKALPADGLKSTDIHAPNKTTSDSLVRGIIIQNTLGNPVDIVAIEKFAKKHDLKIIEDLAHCTGVKYPDGREAGTVGVATALSFGKDKSIDTISGGAVIFRSEASPHKPQRSPRPSDHLRARFYPLFGAIAQGLSYVHLSGAWMRLLIRLHWIEKSADNKLDLTRKISKFQAKMALRQLKALKKSGEPPLREFYLVKDREEVLDGLKKAGYYFTGFWYEKPVSPKRYYKKVHFPEEACPNAVFVSEHIVNLPTHYSKKALELARKIIKEHLCE